MFPNGTIRVVTPVTEDGNRPKIVDGMPVYKETFLPKTAKRAMEKQNDRLPNHLKKSIEVLEDAPVTVQPKAEAAPPKPRVKPGPKPKQNAQTN